MEGVLTGVEVQGNLPGAAEEASLLHGHWIGISLCEFSAWPREVANSSNVATDQSIG